MYVFDVSNAPTGGRGLSPGESILTSTCVTSAIVGDGVDVGATVGSGVLSPQAARANSAIVSRAINVWIGLILFSMDIECCICGTAYNFLERKVYPTTLHNSPSMCLFPLL